MPFVHWGSSRVPLWAPNRPARQSDHWLIADCRALNSPVAATNEYYANWAQVSNFVISKGSRKRVQLAVVTTVIVVRLQFYQQLLATNRSQPTGYVTIGQGAVTTSPATPGCWHRGFAHSWARVFPGLHMPQLRHAMHPIRSPMLLPTNQNFRRLKRVAFFLARCARDTRD